MQHSNQGCRATAHCMGVSVFRIKSNLSIVRSIPTFYDSNSRIKIAYFSMHHEEGGEKDLMNIE